MIRSGRFVKEFDWPDAQRRNPTLAGVFAALAGGYAALNTAAETSGAKLAALSGDQNFTQVGRRNQMRAWFDAEGVAALKTGRAALAEAEKTIEAIRGRMRRAQIDKTDAAAAVLRSDLRRWLREMDPGERTAKIRMGDLPSDAIAAILEAPAEMSGLNADQYRRIEAAEIATAHPEEVAQIRDIEEAVEALATAERAATLAFQKDAGIGRGDIAEKLGEPTLGERLREKLGAGEDEPAEAA